MTDDDRGFAAWYAAYPLKQARRGAERSYKASLKRGATPLQLMEALTQQKAAKAAKQAAGEWVPSWPMPKTWLNQDCHLDEVDQPQSDVDMWGRCSRCEQYGHARRDCQQVKQA